MLAVDATDHVLLSALAPRLMAAGGWSGRPPRHHPQRHPLREGSRRRLRRLRRGRAYQDGGARRAAAGPVVPGAEAGRHRGRHLPGLGHWGWICAGDTGVLAVDATSHVLLGALTPGPMAAGGWSGRPPRHHPQRHPLREGSRRRLRRLRRGRAYQDGGARRAAAGPVVPGAEAGRHRDM